MLLTIVCAIAAEHIRYFEPGPIHFPAALEVLGYSGRPLNANHLRVQIERALGGANLDGGEAQILGRGSEVAMTKQQLDGAHVGAGFQQMNGKGVPSITIS